MTNEWLEQWSFRKTRTMRTMASTAEIGVLIQAPKALLRESGSLSLGKKFWDCICKFLQYSAFLAGKWFAMPSITRSYQHFNDGNDVPTRSGSFSTMGTTFPIEMSAGSDNSYAKFSRRRYILPDVQGGPKKTDTLCSYALISSNIDRFSNLFHCQNLNRKFVIIM